MKKYLTFFCAFLSLYFVNAQEKMKDSVKTDSLDEVVIVASRKHTKITDIPGTVWVVPKQKLQNLIATGIPIKEMLGQLVPGMDVGPQGRTNFGQNMRGRAMLIMIDGVSLNSLRGASRQLDAIDPFNIERIEVLSGASSIYGGNATGGIINIVTKTSKKEGLAGETKLSYRSGFMGKEEGDFSIAQSFAVKKDNFKGRLGVAFQNNGGVYGADKKQVYTDITQTDLQYNKTIDVLATGAYQFNKKHSISLLGQFYDSKYDGDRVLSLGKNFGSILTNDPKLLQMKNGFSSDQKIGTRRYMGIVSYKATDVLGGQDLHLQLASRGEELGFYPFPGMVSVKKPKGDKVKTLYYTSSSEQNTDYKGVKIVLYKNWNSFNVVYGFDGDFENFEAFRNSYDVEKAFSSGGLVNKTIFTTGRYPDINSKSYAGYFQGKIKILPVLTLNTGLRYQYNNVKVSDFIGTKEQVLIKLNQAKSADVIKGGTSNYNVFLFNGGLLFKPNEQHQVWGNFSQGAKLADPAKLYGDGKYDLNFTTQNLDLKKSVNINDTKLQGIITSQGELGYRTKLNGFKLQLAGFYSLSDKNIKVDYNKKGNLSIIVENFKLRRLGIEAEASYTIDNGFYVGANTLIIKSEKRDSHKWLKESIAKGAPSPSKVAGYVGYQNNNFSFRLLTQQTFDLKDQEDNKIKGYNVADVNLGYKTQYGKFSLAIQNMFNTNYQTVWSVRAEKLYGKFYPVPGLFNYKGRGRTFNISYTLDF